MVNEKSDGANLKSIRWRVCLLFFISVTYIQVTSGQNLCPLKCTCYLNHEPRRIVCSNQAIENYPSNISDLVQYLDLSKNILESIPDELNNLIDLQYLNLAQNKLKSLPKNLQQLGQLQKLDLSNNNIAEISDIASISHLTSLKVFYLSKNPLTRLDDLTNVALRALDVSKCSINNISSTSLKGLPELVTLSLEGNPLKSIQRLTSDKLRWLDLSDCYLNYLTPDTFEGAPDLEQLRLSNNPTLVYSSRNETLRHDNLKRLDVSRCNLDRPGLHGFPALTHAVLSHNVIRMLPDRIFGKNRVLAQLQLDGNGLSIVNKSSFGGLVKLEALDLSSNSLSRLHPFTFRETINLRMLNLSLNDFEKIPNILSTLVSLDISSNFIENVPRQLFTNMPRIRTLDLSDNRLEGVCDSFESETLRNLVLKRNRLVELANSSFSELPELEKLDLSGNRLTEGMNFEIFASNENLRDIILEDNPWRCDCHQLYRTFVYLTELPAKTKSESLICQSPSNVSGFSWEVACYRDWNDGRNLDKDRTWGLVMLTLLVVVLIFGTSVSLRHTFAIKRQARLERARIEREEGIERLRLLRRRNLELEAAANELTTSEPRIHPMELIDPPPYEEAVQMPRMAQSLDALDSISMDPLSRQIIGSVESLRGRKRRPRRARNRTRSEENLSRREERSQIRRGGGGGGGGGGGRSTSRRNYSSSLTSVASRTGPRANRSVSDLIAPRNISSIATRRDTESEERSSDSKRRPRPQTPSAKRKRRRQPSRNGNSTDDEDSDVRENIIQISENNSFDKPIVIRELPREPRSAYRPTVQADVV